VYLSIPLDDWDLKADSNATGLLTQRRVEGNPIVADRPLQDLADLVGRATNPVLVLGPGVDTDLGWSGGIRLAERAGLPV
jgi:benzoylformate decarboxylase